MTDKQTAIAAFEAALQKLGGAHGDLTADDMRQCTSACADAGTFLPAARAKHAMLTALEAEPAQDPAQTAEAFVSAAMSGMPTLMRELAVVLMVTQTSPALGGALLRNAVSGGDWIAGFLLLREAGRGRHFASAADLHAIAQRLSMDVPLKEDIAAAAAAIPADAAAPPATFQKALCLEAVHKLLEGPGDTDGVLFAEPLASVSYPGILSALECDYLIAIASQVMRPSKVVEAALGDSISAHYRTSDDGMILPVLFDLPLIGILRKLSSTADRPPEHAEFLSMLRYRPGQEYRPHHDYLEEDDNDYSQVKACGQREATLLTYLNDGYEGGETGFPELDLTYKGAAGDALYFRNTDTDGQPLPHSLHAGLPVTRGEKWLATLWFREKPFWSWRR